MQRLKQSSYVISIWLNPKWLPSGRQTRLLSPLIGDFICSMGGGAQPENIISAMHNIVSMSICLFVIFRSLCTALWWWVSCNGSPAGHLTPVCLYYFRVVWSKMAPPMGFVTSESPPPPPPPPLVLHNRVVVSCGEEGFEGVTAGGLFRQDSCGVRNCDACQLCKARLSPCISFQKKGCHGTMQKMSIMCTSPVFTTVSLVSRMFLRTSDDVLF